MLPIIPALKSTYKQDLLLQSSEQNPMLYNLHNQVHGRYLVRQTGSLCTLQEKTEFAHLQIFQTLLRGSSLDSFL